MKILFISAEVFPFAKRGGLADVAGSLPKALAKAGHELLVVMPAYRQIENGYQAGNLDVEPLGVPIEVPIGGGRIELGAFRGQLPGSDVPIYFLAKGDMLGREDIYGYNDDAYRFTLFSRAALYFVVEQLKWQPDIVHAHDWHTAPAITWLATAGQADWRYRDIRTVFTIHNLAHQGHTNWHIFDYLGVLSHSLEEENYGEVNFMARGIYHATKINTVSPTYAHEITTIAGGAGLDGLLRHRQFDVHGILNGLDYDVWDPQTDPNLEVNYGIGQIDLRAQNKAALQRSVGLPERSDVPVVAMVSRLDWQKGLDLMGEVIHRLLSEQAGDAQFVLLGSGEAEYEQMFTQFANYYPQKAAAILAYRADLAPLIYAGSDMFLMPSLFEPCGLGQMIAMRYGCIPIVRATGGLADTVRDAETGFLFDEFNTDSFWHAMQRATYTFNVDRPYWRNMQMQAMGEDFSWDRSAVEYTDMYNLAIGKDLSAT